MRNHVQGLGLLLVLAMAVWGTARLAAPAVGDAFGDDDSAASTTEDIIELSAGDDDAPLTPEEVFGLQWYLELDGYDTGGVDGLMGPGTRSAIVEAKADHALATVSDRALFDFLLARYNDPTDPSDDVPELSADEDPDAGVDDDPGEGVDDDRAPVEGADTG